MRGRGEGPRGGGRVMLWVNKKRRRKCKCPSTARRQERKNKACKTTHNGHKRVVSIDRKALCEIFTQKPAHTPFFPLSVSFLDTHTPVRAQERTHAHIRTHTHTHTHTHTRARKHTHTHIYTHKTWSVEPFAGSILSGFFFFLLFLQNTLAARTPTCS